MPTLHFQSHASVNPCIFLSSFHPSPQPPENSGCISFLPLGRKASPTHFSLRSKDSVALLLRSRTLPAYASNSESSERSGVSKASEASAGPPFLTILAGLLVFFAVCWAFGSIVVWLFSLIVEVASPK